MPAQVDGASPLPKLGHDPTVGEVERAAAATEEPDHTGQQWLEAALASELHRGGDAPEPPDQVAPAEGRMDAAGEIAEEPEEAAEADNEYDEFADEEGMFVATSYASPMATGPLATEPQAAGPADGALWHAIDHLRSQRFPRRKMMSHLGSLTKQVHAEAVYQRDVQK